MFLFIFMILVNVYIHVYSLLMWIPDDSVFLFTIIFCFTTLKPFAATMWQVWKSWALSLLFQTKAKPQQVTNWWCRNCRRDAAFRCCKATINFPSSLHWMHRVRDGVRIRERETNRSTNLLSSSSRRVYPGLVNSRFAHFWDKKSFWPCDVPNLNQQTLWC